MSQAPCAAVTVKIPGSTSNCGAGFDTLGLALSLYNYVAVARVEGIEPMPVDAGDFRAAKMVAEVATLFFDETEVEPAGFSFHITGDVPAARGLGSSVTVIAGVLAGLNAVHAAGLSARDLVALATKLEGHPDNASAGVLGGFCVSRCDPVTGAYVDTVRVIVPAELAFVVVSPEVEMLTKEARGVLPATILYFDAVRSINSATYLTAAFATGDFEKLRHAVGDFMHEPYRLPRIPGARNALDAGVAAGAYTGWLSGSGSSVLCVSPHGNAPAVVAAMTAAFREKSIACEAKILTADNTGLQVLAS